MHQGQFFGTRKHCRLEGTAGLTGMSPQAHAAPTKSLQSNGAFAARKMGSTAPVPVAADSEAVKGQAALNGIAAKSARVQRELLDKVSGQTQIDGLVCERVLVSFVCAYVHVCGFQEGITLDHLRQRVWLRA